MQIRIDEQTFVSKSCTHRASRTESLLIRTHPTEPTSVPLNTTNRRRLKNRSHRPAKVIIVTSIANGRLPIRTFAEWFTGPNRWRQNCFQCTFACMPQNHSQRDARMDSTMGGKNECIAYLRHLFHPFKKLSSETPN